MIDSDQKIKLAKCVDPRSRIVLSDEQPPALNGTPATADTFIEQTWDKSIVPTLMEYVRIPNKSPEYDAKWQENGHMDRALSLVENWCRDNGVEGMKLDVVRLPGRTPLLFMEIPGQSDDTVLMYGHLDKQPEMSGWSEGLGPYQPVLRGDRLYGRGAADDGYAAFASLTAVKALQEKHRPHARCVVMIESGEESGSPDLPAYINELAERIGQPSLVVCLDSGCGDYEHLWGTTSLRGLVSGTLKVDVLGEGVHSGDAGGVVPSSFRVMRQLLSRVEDENTGQIPIKECNVEIPSARRQQAAAVARTLGAEVHNKFPFLPGVEPTTDNATELILNRTWRPAMAYTGIGGLPDLANAGNVMRPQTALKLSLRLPPTADADKAASSLKAVLEKDPPYGAKVSFQGEGAPGWNAPPMADWLGRAMRRASLAHFGKEAMYVGEGGSIPFMGMLGQRFPRAQFLITGLLGPHSNAHGPDEFLHIPTGKRLTASLADILEAHYQQGVARSPSPP